MMENMDSKIGKMAPSSIGQTVAKMIDREKWGPGKIVIILLIILVLPLGPLVLGLYVAAREAVRKKRGK